MSDENRHRIVAELEVIQLLYNQRRVERQVYIQRQTELVSQGIGTLDDESLRSLWADLVRQRKATETPVNDNRRRVFISYAHSDNQHTDPNRRWLDVLKEHLQPYVRQGEITYFCDHDINIGDRWSDEIQSALREAEVAILLVSRSFLASTYIANDELPVLLKQSQDDGLVVLSIIISPCAFTSARFKFPDPVSGPEEVKLSVFQAANPPDETLIELNDGARDRVLASVAERVRGILNPA